MRTLFNDHLAVARVESSSHAETASSNVRCSILLRVRYLQVLLILLCSCVLFMMRSTMSVAVLAMTTPQTHTNVEVYDWDKNVKGMILSSFFWGYTLLQIPAGILAKKYGGHPLLLGSLIASGLLYLTLPTFAKYGGWMAVCAIQSVMGLAQACLLPSYHPARPVVASQTNGPG
ncbi:Putative inorganic phosphate cotransporter [Eumeta japonica]|uniref:Inorganic phosphate cotransporter n=1 Tax=Eumeta variegata TaxID=151549 RepID=A0A4C2AFG7_EUMVA|nr:Putative inorganic phosphate cotransporter [Eumeta japonica]